MNCCDYYDKEDSKKTDNDNFHTQLKDVAKSFVGTLIDGAYQQGFNDGYEKGKRSKV